MAWMWNDLNQQTNTHARSWRFPHQERAMLGQVGPAAATAGITIRKLHRKSFRDPGQFPL